MDASPRVFTPANGKNRGHTWIEAYLTRSSLMSLVAAGEKAASSLVGTYLMCFE